ncbi:MAG: hypothetical protein KA313_08645 [Pseudarcicella sp.]|nr:hypothetical protein [Pseudarcicella sp.]
MESNHQGKRDLPNWVLISTFVLFCAILWIWGDTFTAIVGTIFEGLVFMGYSDGKKAHSH